jgi:hypothetical protein
METITLNKIHEDILSLRKEMNEMKILIEEDLEISDEVVQEIEESRSRPKEEFVSQDNMMKEFN